MSVLSEAPLVLTDQAVLDRFNAAGNLHPAGDTLGGRVKAVNQAEHRVEVAFDARADRLGNPFGQIQGGMICAMLDETLSLAVVVASQLTCFAPTLEMKTSFLRPTLPGPLLGVGWVIKWGKTVAFAESELYDADGHLLAKASGTVKPTPIAKFK